MMSEEEVELPDAVVATLQGRPEVGSLEQAFPLLTVSPSGFPSVCLLSRAEIAARPDEVYAVVRGSGVKEGLSRGGQATLVVIDGTTAFYCRLRVTRLVEDSPYLAVAFVPVGYKADSLGLPLAGITFRPTVDLTELEGWSRTDALLKRLMDSPNASEVTS